jgi:glycosyltransferase involved in cell wall biosynthesis
MKTKKRLAIICGILYPDPSPTGMCAKRFADLLADEYDIDIICISTNGICEMIDYADGIRVHTLSGGMTAAEARSRGLIAKSAHLIGCLQIKMQLLGNLTWFKSAAHKKLTVLHSEYGLDAVFSICSPFSAHCAAKVFCDDFPTVHWCGYTVDPYTTQNRIRPFWCSYKRLAEKERRILSAMDSVLLSEEVFDNRKELYKGCQSCNALPYILPKRVNIENTYRFFDKKEINCVYAGSFYRDLRNPEAMLKAFADIKDSPIKLHLFCSGCEDIVSKYAAVSDNIIIHGRVSVEEISQVYSEADILVSIGNAVSEFLPSKTYEYIAAGKPVINFYYASPDKVFQKYPICLQLPNSSDAQNEKKLQSFITLHNKEILDEKTVADIYNQNSAEYASKILHDNMLQN